LQHITARIEKDNLWHSRIEIPLDYLKECLLENEKRVVISLYGIEFQRAIHRKKETDLRYIYLSTEMLKRLNAKEGDLILLEIKKDTSELQAPMPEEWEAVLWDWPEVEGYFNKLSIGKRRSIVFAIDRLKTSDARIRKALHFARKLTEGETELKGLFSK
jgi:uncharacterized protein YdeI (YjbR/CyaY-like superfamily)